MSITTLITRQRVLAAKAETTNGTAIALAAADATEPTFDMALKYDAPVIKRPSPGTASQFAGPTGARSGEATFTTHVHGNGTTGDPAFATILLPACGMVGATSVYTPITGSSSATTLTMGLYQDGRLKTITGASGTWVMKGTAGEPVSMDWRFLGKYAAPTATALILPTYNVTLPPRLANATITIASTAYKISDFELDLGAKLVLVKDASAADATGYAWCVVADYEPVLTVKLMALAIGTKDWFADVLTSTEVAFSAAIGSVTNNTITVAAPKCQLMGPPEDEDSDGYMTDVLKFQLNKNADAGDDFLSITFS
jgi:hypothetical protein